MAKDNFTYVQSSSVFAAYSWLQIRLETNRVFQRLLLQAQKIP